MSPGPTNREFLCLGACTPRETVTVIAGPIILLKIQKDHSTRYTEFCGALPSLMNKEIS